MRRQQRPASSPATVSAILARPCPFHCEPACTERARIGQRAMPVGGGETVACDQRIEIVRRSARVEPSRHHYRAEDRGVEADACALELGFEERVVEAGVVRNEETARQSLCQPERDVLERRRRLGKQMDRACGRSRRTGLRSALLHHERSPFVGRAIVNRHDTDLGDAIGRRIEAGGLDVDEGKPVEIGHLGSRAAKESRHPLSNERSMRRKRPAS